MVGNLLKYGTFCGHNYFYGEYMFIIEHRIFSVPSIFFKTAALRKIPLILPIKQSLFHAIRTYRSLGQTLIFSTIHGHNCLFWVYYAH